MKNTYKKNYVELHVAINGIILWTVLFQKEAAILRWLDWIFENNASE